MIASGDGTGNVTAPVDDPGWANVGILNSPSAVYVGNGWVVSANHVGEGPVLLGGVEYPSVPGSRARLFGPGTARPDVEVMKIVGDPGLPSLSIATTAPPVGADVIMIGRGASRGDPVTWMGVDGFGWRALFDMRWGTNRISETGSVLANTQSLVVEFDEIGRPGSTLHEAQAATGDSGGAVFWKNGTQWTLAGVMFVTIGFEGQPAQTALYTNATGIVDLSFYRDQILDYVTRPACSDGLDDDLDGLADHPADPGCDGPDDASEQSSALECDDGIDNDLDGAIDHPADPQCTSPSTTSEASAVPLGGTGLLTALVGCLIAVGVRNARRDRR